MSALVWGLDVHKESTYATILTPEGAPIVTAAIVEIFGSNEYKKVLVAWEVEDESVIEQARKQYDIEIWKMSDVLNELIQEVGTKAFRDDVLRTVQLITMRNSAI